VLPLWSTLAVSTKPTLTITADPATSVYGAPLMAPATLPVTYSGFVKGDGGLYIIRPAMLASDMETSKGAVRGSLCGGVIVTSAKIINVLHGFTMTAALGHPPSRLK